MKVIEVIYPEFSNNYAELYNIEYISKCNNNIKVIYTNYGSIPYFTNNNVDMIYMGSVSDYKLPIIIEELKKYKDNFIKYINKNKIMLLTGNAMEIFGKYIKENNRKFNCLSIFEYHIEKDMSKKHASWFIGEFNNIKIVGHKNTFSKCVNIKNKFIRVLGGYSSDLLFNKGNEGFHYKNVYATDLLGPFLIMNPLFVKYLLKTLGLNDKILFNNDVMDSYYERLKFFDVDNCRYDMSDHG